MTLLKSLILFIAPLCLAADLPKQTVSHYQITLRLPPDGLYAREEAQIEFRIEDTSRPDPLTGFAPVIRAVPDAVIDMPDMPTMAKFSETAHAEGVPGDYGIHPTFAHGGPYRLRISIHPPGADAFPVEFPLTVLDAEQAGKRKPQPPRYTMEVSAQPRKPKAGETVELRFTVRDRDSGNALVTSFETVHEALLHLVVVRRDLSRFVHEHPALDPDGTFHLTYTFTAGGEYRLFADLAPKGAGGQILTGKLAVSGREGNGFDIHAADASRTRQAGDCSVNVGETSLPARKTVRVVFTLNPECSLEPYLGAMGHLMLVHEDASTFVHSHPDEGPAGTLSFLSRLPKPGLYRGWLQFRRNGQVWTADFLLRAEADR